MSVSVCEPVRFWGTSSPREHLIEVYKSESAFIDGLVAFASDGLAAGEAFVMLATAEHRDAVEQALRERGHDLDADTFVALDAESTLARFMVDGEPDAKCFEAVIGAVLARASAGGRPVRAFGEMVALLWMEGRREATLRVEQLWNEVLRRHPLSLFCAYPRLDATREITEDFAHVCAAHSQVAFT
jgi:hypothetical protein